jgi:hypothetical protein
MLDEANGTADAYTWIIEEGDTSAIETMANCKYMYLKNKATGQYMGTWDEWSVRLPMSETKLLYFARSAGGVKYNIGSYDAVLNFASNNETYPFLHILGHDDGKASWGHICLWSYNADPSRWKFVLANETSISDDIVDDAEGEVVSVTYYSADGKVSATAFDGVNIVKTVYANGTIKTTKVIR